MSVTISFCSSQTTPETSNKKDFKWLNAYMKTFNDERGFSGSVLIAKNDEIVFQKAIGWTDVEKGKLNNLDTRFNLMSGTKMFTAVAIAQLAEQGKLKFDVPIINYLPNYPNQAFAKKATIHDLLTHSSGLKDYWDDEYEKHWLKIKTLKETLLFISDTLLFEPGEKRKYTNSGYIVLGLIIEKITGLSYYDYIKKNIYVPAEMDRTDSYELDGTIPDLAVNYQGISNKWYVAPYGIKGNSAHGGFSTVADMFKFHKALQTNKLISASLLKLIQSDKTPVGETTSWNYGYGFTDEIVNGYKCVGHGGLGYGIYFKYRYFTELGYTVILFSNAQSGLPDVLLDRINNYITSKELERPAFLENEKVEAAKTRFTVEIVPPPKNRDGATVLESAPEDNLSRYWTIIDGITKSLNTKDQGLFNSFFAKLDAVTVASNKSMYTFFVKKVFPLRGKIVEFHSLSPPVEMQDSSFPMRIATFHLKNGFPGSITVALNNEGKIDHLSLFVHRQICPNLVDSNCSKVTKQVGK